MLGVRGQQWLGGCTVYFSVTAVCFAYLCRVTFFFTYLWALAPMSWGCYKQASVPHCARPQQSVMSVPFIPEHILIRHPYGKSSSLGLFFVRPVEGAFQIMSMDPRCDIRSAVWGSPCPHLTTSFGVFPT